MRFGTAFLINLSPVQLEVFNKKISEIMNHKMPSFVLYFLFFILEKHRKKEDNNKVVQKITFNVSSLKSNKGLYYNS